MKRLVAVAVAVAVLAGAVMPVPALAGGFSFDLPNLTWPDEAADQGTQDGAPVLATKNAKG